MFQSLIYICVPTFVCEHVSARLWTENSLTEFDTMEPSYVPKYCSVGFTGTCKTPSPNLTQSRYQSIQFWSSEASMPIYHKANMTVNRGSVAVPPAVQEIGEESSRRPVRSIFRMATNS